MTGVCHSNQEELRTKLRRCRTHRCAQALLCSDHPETRLSGAECSVIARHSDSPQLTFGQILCLRVQEPMPETQAALSGFSTHEWPLANCVAKYSSSMSCALLFPPVFGPNCSVQMCTFKCICIVSRWHVTIGNHRSRSARITLHKWQTSTTDTR